MKIIALDDEISALHILIRAIQEAVPDAKIKGYLTVTEAVNEVQINGFRPDVAFIDIEMPGMSGLKVGNKIKEICPQVNLVFVTGYSQYAINALKLRPSGYVMKPATKEKILAELDNLRNPPSRQEDDRIVKVQCFGNFEVFVNGEIVTFSRAKSKEYLAYLIERRGSSCSSAEVASVLWEDGVYNRSRQKQCQVFRQEMMKALKTFGIENIIIKGHNAMAVDITQFGCDYYDALQGDIIAINSFTGSFMEQYSWAEYVIGILEKKVTT